MNIFSKPLGFQKFESLAGSNLTPWLQLHFKTSIQDKLPLILTVVAMYSVTAGVYFAAANLEFKAVQELDAIRAVILVMLAPLLVKYVFQLASALLYPFVEELRRMRLDPDWQPAVSVIIPAWNEEVGIVKTIKSVLDTRYAPLQIIVINDGSSDSTHEQICKFINGFEAEKRDGLTLLYINQSNTGKARALNRALLKATGEIVITIDADSVMDRDAITHFVSRFSSPRVGAVAGNVIVGNRQKTVEWMQQLEYLYGFFFKRADSIFNSIYIVGGAAAAYRKDILMEMGGFDHSIITEDIEMSTRILSRGYKTRYAADAVVYTEGPCDFKGLCNQRLRWKYGRILTFIKHRSLFFRLQSNISPYLTLMLLPMAVYAEFLLLIEFFMLAIFFFYTYMTNDYMPLATVITILAVVSIVQVMMDSKQRFHRNLILLAPVTWLVFYVMDMIELQALYRSLKRFILRRELKWQKWVRVGLLSN